MDAIPSRGIHRRLQIELTDDVKRRFWLGVDKRGDNECWNWQRSCRQGYGALKAGRSIVSCHRLSYVMHYGEPEECMLICHTCDNRLCCNPNHLVAGSPRQNVVDAIDRKRMVAYKGDQHPQARYSDEFVRAVWYIRQMTGWGASRIEKQLQMKRGSLRKIIERRTYQHLIPETELT